MYQNRPFRSHLNNHAIIGLTVVSFLNTTTELPIALEYLRTALVSPIRINFIPTFIDEITYYYLYYTHYLVQLLMPLVFIACLPEI
ncbi:unnamed protein product [Rotaria socialis]|uniref:Uncharacterized protein n=1 Tax=Rotaria socialis TaxID=392032 RepID=A0A820SFK4_9BILA|nr:unnamed protein product [Rotaria socialis]CAF4282386.1 unnamed protein product [Rotaria socialis]CAF4321754.1 unnamed protein product [Rotaria socialis]CAF4450529.1 unnamed protein product [Rotaria socialis]CAF4657848.1 unnamed protein product [Rotaria socialis]